MKMLTESHTSNPNSLPASCQFRFQETKKKHTEENEWGVPMYDSYYQSSISQVNARLEISTS